MLTDPAASARGHLRKHWKSIFFTKLTDWQSEHDYRFVESSMNKGYTFAELGEALAGVILGWKFPDWQKDGAFAQCKQLGALTWRMSWAWSRPSPRLIGPE